MYAASFEDASSAGKPISVISALLNWRRATSAKLASSVETQNVLRGFSPASVFESMSTTPAEGSPIRRVTSSYLTLPMCFFW